MKTRVTKVVSNYSTYMATDGMADHYTASYGFTKKSHTWWQTLFFQVLEV